MLNVTVGFVNRFRTSPFQLEADEREYYEIARSIISGAVKFSPRRSLGFPAIESGILKLTGDFLMLQTVIVSIYSLAAPLLFLLVRKLTSDMRMAWLSAGILMFWPPAVYYGTSMYSETVALPLFLISLVLLPVGSRIRSVGPHPALLSLSSGACLGATTHVRPMYLMFLPMLLGIMLIEEVRPAVALRRFALVISGFSLIIAPWSILMTNRYHHLIVVTSNGGETLAGGLNPQLLKMGRNREILLRDRKSWVGPGKWLPIETTGYLTDGENGMTYDQKDALLKSRTLNWAEHYPKQAAYLELSKLRYLWGFSSFNDSDLFQTLFGAVPTMLLLIGSMFLWFKMPILRWQYPRLWLLPIFVSGIALISWGSWRFRQVGDVGLIAMCVIGTFILVDRRQSSALLR